MRSRMPPLLNAWPDNVAVGHFQTVLPDKRSNLRTSSVGGSKIYRDLFGFTVYRNRVT